MGWFSSSLLSELGDVDQFPSVLSTDSIPAKVTAALVPPKIDVIFRTVYVMIKQK